MCDTFLWEVAREHVLSFSDLKKKCFQNFFDAGGKLDSASVEGFKDFIKEHKGFTTFCYSLFEKC